MTTWPALTYGTRPCECCGTDIENRYGRRFCRACKAQRQTARVRTYRNGRRPPRACDGCQQPIDDALRSEWPWARRCRTCREVRMTRRSLGEIARNLLGERDGWTCWLCREPVDPALPGDHPLGGSIDHVQPIAGGGNHAATNVRLAHLICNVNRGAPSFSSMFVTRATSEEG